MERHFEIELNGGLDQAQAKAEFIPSLYEKLK